jgi:glycerophosphoryl diester phosphodiesterase
MHHIQRKFDMKTPQIYAHRGAHAQEVEMSLAAYKQAVIEGADGFECDVRLTRDDVLVLWHDVDLTRIANSPELISNSTLFELSKKVPIMTAEQLIQFALANQKDIAFETKHPVPSRGRVERKLVTLLKSYEEEIRECGIAITIMSFSWWSVFSLLTLLRPPYKAVQLVWNNIGIRIAIAPVVAIEIDQIRKNIGLVRSLKSRGKKVYVWTVNEVEDARLAQKAGVDVIISDCPEKIRKALL